MLHISEYFFVSPINWLDLIVRIHMVFFYTCGIIVQSMVTIQHLHIILNEDSADIGEGNLFFRRTYAHLTI